MFCDPVGREVPMPAVQRRQLAISAPRAIDDGMLAVGLELSNTGEGGAEFLTYRLACDSYGLPRRPCVAKSLLQVRKIAVLSSLGGANSLAPVGFCDIEHDRLQPSVRQFAA
jgi:hypothetical protein